jgi:hypothetical protein
MTQRLPRVRHHLRHTRSFIPEDSVKATSTTETPLPEHNEPQEPGSATSPKGPHSSIVSAAGLLDLAHPASGGFAPADVLGRRFDTSSTNQMHTTGHNRSRRLHDLDVTSCTASLSRPFLVGCASSVALFYTPHEQGLCRLRLRGRTTYLSDYLSWHIPRGRVHRSAPQHRSPGVAS